MNKTENQYNEIKEMCSNVFKQKLDSYGESFSVFRTQTLLDQIFIKIKRIRTIEENKINSVNEDITNDYISIVNYCLIGLIRLTPDDIDTYSKYTQRFNQSWNLLFNKNTDYGESWREMYVESFTDLMYVKLLRMKNIFDTNINIELLVDNYFDIMNYAIFALIRLKL